jgi:hypothetical protein
MGSSEQNYARLWAMARENQTAIEQSEQQQREQEYLREMQQPEAEDVLTEALAQPLETRNQRDRRELEEQEQRFARERRRRERAAEPAAPDVSLLIAEAVANERLFMRQVNAEANAELKSRQETAIDAAVHPLKAELAQLKAAIAEERVKICELQISDAAMRERLAGGRSSKIVDLPNPLRSVN